MEAPSNLFRYRVRASWRFPKRLAIGTDCGDAGGKGLSRHGPPDQIINPIQPQLHIPPKTPNTPEASNICSAYKNPARSFLTHLLSPKPTDTLSTTDPFTLPNPSFTPTTYSKPSSPRTKSSIQSSLDWPHHRKRITGGSMLDECAWRQDKQGHEEQPEPNQKEAEEPRKLEFTSGSDPLFSSSRLWATRSKKKKKKKKKKSLRRSSRANEGTSLKKGGEPRREETHGGSSGGIRERANEARKVRSPFFALAATKASSLPVPPTDTWIPRVAGHRCASNAGTSGRKVAFGTSSSPLDLLQVTRRLGTWWL
ncbi:hypothetical protein KM043_003425 [Ampulex compressa]|nr:hypothetical protein KM043_003425 [Ampulex compressa]